ncbi:hypothetical protein NDU88_000588 [Pleurodeles waltl]|uniref:Uncharacterized protein n=1 Tax=Pleurodeles waltl TaxID=8319 RepID=A0AAV7U6R6_PLEWA|nr:hypothetical protein NDU88_000588 [Pleurodeles waltl]
MLSEPRLKHPRGRKEIHAEHIPVCAKGRPSGGARLGRLSKPAGLARDMSASCAATRFAVISGAPHASGPHGPPEGPAQSSSISITERPLALCSKRALPALDKHGGDAQGTHRRDPQNTASVNTQCKDAHAPQRHPKFCKR